jgi:hypothetical protein
MYSTFETNIYVYIGYPKLWHMHALPQSIRMHALTCLNVRYIINFRGI